MLLIDFNYIVNKRNKIIQSKNYSFRDYIIHENFYNSVNNYFNDNISLERSKKKIKITK